MSILRTLVLVGAVSLVGLASRPVFADHDEHGDKGDKGKPSKTKGAPEIDPAVLGGAAVLLVGGTLLVGARVRRKRAS
jgi:hypothetical protein